MQKFDHYPTLSAALVTSKGRNHDGSLHFEHKTRRCLGQSSLDPPPHVAMWHKTACAGADRIHGATTVPGRALSSRYIENHRQKKLLLFQLKVNPNYNGGNRAQMPLSRLVLSSCNDARAGGRPELIRIHKAAFPSSQERRNQANVKGCKFNGGKKKNKRPVPVSRETFQPACREPVFLTR